MTVAAFIGVGETPRQGLGKTPGTVQGAGRASAAASELSSSTIPAATSFRAGWQSLLASMGPSVNATSQSVNESDQGNTLTGPASEQIPETTSASTLAAIIGLRQEQGQDQGTVKESVETGAEAMLSSAGVLTQTLAAKPASTSPASTSIEEKKPAAKQETESTRSSHPSRFTSTAKTDAVSAEPLPGLVPAAVAVVVSQVTQSTNEPAQLAQTEISAALSTDQQAAVVSASLDAHSPVAVNATIQQRQTSPASNLSNSSGSTLSEADSAVTDKGTSPTVALPAEGGNTTETTASVRGLTQSSHAAAQNANPTEALAPSQTPSQTFTPNQYRSQTIVQDQEQLPTQQQNQSVNMMGAQLSALSKPASSGGAKTQTPESVRGNSNIDSIQPISHLTAGQSSVPAVDASAMTRALDGAGGIVSSTVDAAGASSFAATGPDSREAFATLDSAVAPVATTWIHAGTQRAEAGYLDSALGWVGVRADLSGGGVHAQLVPGSADAAQALDGHLAGLNAYLAEHHSPVETLTLTVPESGWSGLGSGQGAGEGTQQGAGQQSAQGADVSSPSGQNSESVIQSPAPSAELPAFFGDMDGISHSASLDGLHISVMA